MNALRRMRDRLLGRFQEPEYRQTYVEAFLNTSIAAQIRALRRSRKLSQKQLGVLIGTKQSGVSALENVNYSRWSLSTLRKIARVFDVALVVRFESFGEILDDITSFDAAKLDKPSFDQDPVFQQQRSTVDVVRPIRSDVARVRSMTPVKSTPWQYVAAGQTFHKIPRGVAGQTAGVVPTRGDLVPPKLLQYGSGGQTQ